MPDFYPNTPSSPYGYPSHLTIPQFILDETHPLRPTRANNAWIVDDQSGRTYGLEEIRERVWALAKAFKARWGIRPGDVVCLYSSNDIDYPIAIWALHRLGATVSCANPMYTPSELEYQLKVVSARLLLSAAASLPVAQKAAATFGLPASSIVVFSPPSPQPTHKDTVMPARVEREFQGHATIAGLVAEGRGLVRDWEEEQGPEVGLKIAFLSFSSGTTGLPKAIAITHRNVIANVLQMSSHCRVNDPSIPWDERLLRPGDVSLGTLPMYHIYGLVVNLHFVLFAGITLVVFPRFNFVEMIKSIVRHRITTLWIVPPQVVMFTQHPEVRKHDLSHLRFCMVGAAPLSKEVTEKFKGLLPSIRMGQGYGMTETCTVVSMFPHGMESINGSAGQLITDTVARVVKSDGKVADFDEPGELWTQGPQMAICYTNSKEATAETFLPGGWVRTGDEALMTREGNLYVVDRLKEILKVNGYQVAPAELEGQLVVHPYVVDAGVVGIQDERKGEVPLAFVVLEPKMQKRVAKSAKEADEVRKVLYKHVADHKVKYKWLDGGIEFVDAIPKNPSGKILRRILREHAKEVVKKRTATGPDHNQLQGAPVKAKL